MPEPLRPPGKTPAPQRSRFRKWLGLGPGKAELLDALEFWRARAEQNERERNESQALAKQRRRELGQVRQTAEQQAAALRQQLRDELVQAWKDGDARVARVRGQLNALLNQPADSGKCVKVRFHQRPEAEEWLLQVAANGGTSPELYKTYPCDDCPRSPVTIRRFWHVAHLATKEARDAAAASKARHSQLIKKSFRAGTALEQRVDPAILAKLNALRNLRPDEGDNP